MIVVDANLLLYAYNSASPHHHQAKDWLKRELGKPSPFGIPWQTILAFLRIGTNPRAFPHPLSTSEASAIVSEWLNHPAVTIPQPGDRHWEILANLLKAAQANGPLVSDAHLAALAIEHGASLCTSDKDFSRFPGLTFENPLKIP